MNPQQRAQVEMMKLEVPKQKAIIALKERLIEARQIENVAHRQYLAGTNAEHLVNAYAAALRDCWYAEADILKLEVFELKARVETMEKIIQQSESPIVGVSQ